MAQLLGVTETTVKRWADAQLLPCMRTPGGHRKFLPHEVLTFAQQHGYRLQEPLATAPFPAAWEPYREWLYRWLLEGDARTVSAQLSAWLATGIELSTLYDEVVCPVLERIGTEWEHGTLSVGQEHVASNALLEALHSLRQRTQVPSPGRWRAICAALEHEEHILGLLMAAHVLESEGFQVDFLGARTPAGDLIEWLKTHPASLLCLSFGMPLSEQEARTLLVPVRDAARSREVRVYAGGRAAHPEWVAWSLVDEVFHSLRALRHRIQECFR